MDPHTTAREGRSCADCHQDSRAVGLGQGSLVLGPGGWDFVSSLAPSNEKLGIDHPLDAFVDIKGRPLVHVSRKGLRPFNRGELVRILNVGICLPCHKDFKDPVMKNWDPECGQSPCRHCPVEIR
ncbi:MAG TPA: hypothetical protein EYP57_06700 [Thermodesulfobacteriaceae bacterium]|nr:hypothetical protein [Thermodesulfobacteriaceae bacterium]